MEKIEEKLWDDYRNDPNLDNRNALVSHYTDLAKKLAMGFYRTYGKSTLDAEDFISWGILGLISAVENYDNNKNTQFSTYAYSRIRGAILDNLNRLGNLPRNMTKKIAALATARKTFIAVNGRNPQDDELASAMKLSMRGLEELLMIERDVGLCSNTETVERCGEEKDPADFAETKELIFNALDKLDDKDYQIFKGIYVDHLPFREVGKRMNCTGAYISLRNSVILEKIQEICGA